MANRAAMCSVELTDDAFVFRNAATTLNVYAHFLEQADRGAADVIGRVIAGDAIGTGGS